MNVSPASSVAQPVGTPVTGASAVPVDVPVITNPPDPTATSDVALVNQPEITAYKNGVVDTSYVGNVTVSVASSNTGTTTLTHGQTVVACVAGVGQFTNIVISDPDVANVTLAFTLDNGRTVNSGTITVTP